MDRVELIVCDYGTYITKTGRESSQVRYQAITSSNSGFTQRTRFPDSVVFSLIGPIPVLFALVGSVPDLFALIWPVS
jgi:hypothetical protein